MKKEKSIFVKVGYLLGIIFCLVASISLVYASYMMISWTFSEHPDIVYSDYSNSYDYYENEKSGQDSDTISDTINGETIMFQELGFEKYAGLVEVSYNLNVPSDTDSNGLEIYFVKSVNGYYQFANSYDSIVTDYKSCQKKNVMTTSGSCTIGNGGGIIIYNTANKPRSFTLSFTIKYDPSLIESN